MNCTEGQENWEDEPPLNEAALLSEAALAEDWGRPEEEAAWSHLQLARPSGKES